MRPARIVRILAAASLVATAACASHEKPSANAVEIKAASQSTIAETLRVNPASANDGGRIYVKNCSSCHQTDGRGVSGAFPPLDENALVTGDPAQVIGIVKFGMRGKTNVSGASYDGTMPAWGQLISDDDIAAVVSYIRTAWHNTSKPVTLAAVQSVKE